MIPKELLPAAMMGSAFIAGGYAACPALASDLDVWVYVARDGDIEDDGERLAQARADILAWLESEMWPFEAQDNNHRPEGATVADGAYPFHSQKVAVVRSPHWSHPIHIIVTTATPAELLEGFDISTHQVAIVFGNVIKGSGWTPVTVPPVKLPGVFNVSTEARMRKIAARYGHPLPNDIMEVR
jgi:hypothetical protein